jgi:hypothetical protein
VPPSPTAISFPTSFTIELDGSITGPVTIAIDALDGNGNVMATGSTTQTHINIGGETIVTVIVGSGAATPAGTSVGGGGGNGGGGDSGGGGDGGGGGGGTRGNGGRGFGGFGNRGTGGA